MDASTPPDLGQQERAVLAAIAANPFVSQQDIARALGLARSTVAAHVVALVQKGHILGRGYVLPEGRRIVCIGGATVGPTTLYIGRSSGAPNSAVVTGAKSGLSPAISKIAPANSYQLHPSAAARCSCGRAMCVPT